MEQSPGQSPPSNGHRRAAEARELLEFVGKWAPDPAFEEILAAQRQIEPEQETPGLDR